MRLYGVEVRRALTRRFVRAIAALALFNIVLASVVVFVRHDSEASTEAKAAAAAAAERSCLAGDVFPPGSPITDEQLRFASGGLPTAPEPGPSRDHFCGVHRDLLESQIRRFELVRTRDVADGLLGILIFLALVIGASLIGAEWAADTIATHLTWEPRRIHTFLAKGMAAMTIGALLFALAQILTVAGLTPAAVFKGVTDVPAGFWGDLAGLIGRGAVSAALMAGFGFAIASAARSTVFALAFTFLLFVLDALIVRRAMPELQRWSFFSNLNGYASGQGVNEVVSSFQIIPGRSAGGAGIVVAIYIGVLLVGGSLLFRRRDVA